MLGVIVMGYCNCLSCNFVMRHIYQYMTDGILFTFKLCMNYILLSFFQIESPISTLKHTSRNGVFVSLLSEKSEGNVKIGAFGFLK